MGRVRWFAVLSIIAAAIGVSGFASAGGSVTNARVSVGSPAGQTPRNHQNEPAVAIDAYNTDFAVAGWNDFIDWAPCPEADATEFGTCEDPADSGIGVSGVAFSFNRGRNWVQPTYTGWTARDCDPTTTCEAHEGAIGTLPWYYENGLVSFGDPAVAVGPIPDGSGEFSWTNGSRVYYANLTGSWPNGFAFPNPEFHGFLGVGVSRLDNPTPTSVLDKDSWMDPVLVNTHTGQTAFEDKEQIWADNAAASPYFGRVYICNPEFRSVGQHRAPGGNFPEPLTFSYSADGGDTWSTKQITAAGTPGRNNPIDWGLSGCTVRTDSDGVVYVFAEMFENPELVGLPTHGIHVMFKSTDGGRSFSKQQIIRQITDPCFFEDPVYGRCVMDGYAGARTDLSAAPSVDIANGAPSGVGATNEIVDAWSDNDDDVNANTTELIWSTDGGDTWVGPETVSQAGDRPMYSAPAISPTGDRIYVVYEADTAPWRGDDMASPRPYHGVFQSAPINADGSPGAWTVLYSGPTDTSLGRNDLRGSYPGHDLYQERIGDYVYAAATQNYGLGLWIDLRRARVCADIQQYRDESLAAGELALPAPWPLQDCPSRFGNADVWSATTG